MVFEIVFGFLLVFAGRNLFWLCVGTVGFLIGIQCAEWFGFSNGWMTLVSAIVLGAIGIILAMSFEWVTVIFIMGFLGGGYLLYNLFPVTAGQGLYAWPIFVVGGIVGMCLMVIIFDWTLIIISSLLGAMLIANTFHGIQKLDELVFMGSAMTGILVQYLTLKGASTRKSVG